MLYSSSTDGSLIKWNKNGSIDKSISFSTIISDFINKNKFDDIPNLKPLKANVGITSFDVNNEASTVAVGLDNGWIVVYDLVKDIVKQK